MQGDETPTIIDTGDVSITTQRVVFQGSKYTREWSYSKLVGIMHYADQPRTAIQVSNREKTSGIVYTNPLSGLVRLRLTVAIAIFNGEAEQTAQQLRGELAALDSGTPAPEAPTVGKPPPAEAVTGSPSPPTPPSPAWSSDPTGRHQSRYWDGARWTDYVADNGRESRDPIPGRPP